MTQVDLAKKLGKTQSYVSKFLRGERGCSLELAKKLTDLFGKDPVWWMESTKEQRRAILNNRGNGNGKD